MRRPVRPRVLTFSSLFPSVARPRHGIFVETRLRHLLRDCSVEARVIAPVPWFPLRWDVFGPYARFAATPRRALRDGGLQVSHPRYLMLPKVGVGFQPDSMARSAWADVAAWRRAGWSPDIIDAHYFYPDGVAAALLAERLQVPFVVTARGSDVNVLGRVPASRARILWAAQRAAALVTVSSRLKDALVDLGVPQDKITVLRNGIDLDVFRPGNRLEARRRLGLPDATVLACVGNLVPEKGHDLALQALQGLPGAHLVIVGDGPLRDELAAQARRYGVDTRVRFLSAMPQQELRHVYVAADALLLTSTREGWPNVVLEALACGTPVVATDVGAVPEMLTRPEAGRIVASRDPRAVSEAVADVLAAPPAREGVRDHAAQFDWQAISRGQFELFAKALGPRADVRAAG